MFNVRIATNKICPLFLLLLNLFFFSVVVCSIVFCSGPSVPPYLPVSLSRCLPESLFLSGENSSLISYSFFIFYFLFFFLMPYSEKTMQNVFVLYWIGLKNAGFVEL